MGWNKLVEVSLYVYYFGKKRVRWLMKVVWKINLDGVLNEWDVC